MKRVKFFIPRIGTGYEARTERRMLADLCSYELKNPLLISEPYLDIEDVLFCVEPL
jgi:hypothetical protein